MRKLASVRRIDSITPIDGADRIEVANIGGWKIVVGKNEFHAGEHVVYFEIDSYLPIDDRYEFLRERCYRKFDKNGKTYAEGFRIKTLKLRGVVSQGLVMPLSNFPEVPSNCADGDDLTELLKVTHYDEISAPFIKVSIPCGDARGDFPSFIPKTDEERCQNLTEYFTDPSMKSKYFELTEKNDGCVRGDTRVMTDIGILPINKIVTHKMNVNVMSYNEIEKRCEYKPVVAWHRYKISKPMCRIDVSRNENDKTTRTKGVYCTTDHMFYTDNGWVEAGKLKPGDTVYQIKPAISELVKQMIAGCMLGDSSFSYNSVHFSHCEKQFDYLEAKSRLLGELWIDGGEYTSGYGSKIRRGHTVANSIIREAATSDIEKYFTPISVAFWVMDDGSLSVSKGERPCLCLHTEGLESALVDKLIGLFKTKFGITATKIICKKTQTYYIRISNNGTEVLASLIAPYVVPCMKYKLPEDFREVPCVLENYPKAKGETLVAYKVIDNKVFEPEKYVIKTGKDAGKRCYNYVFDIEVQDNHNYFANGVLIHNSSCTVFYAPSKFENSEDAFGVCSRNMNLKRSDENKFWATVVKYEERIKQYCKGFGCELAFQGELVGPGIQSNRDMYADYEWHVFRIWNISTGEFVEPSARREICKVLEIPHVHVIDESCQVFRKFKTCEELLKFAEGKTVRGHEREGIVFKETCTGVPVTFKAVSNRYLLKQE